MPPPPGLLVQLAHRSQIHARSSRSPSPTTTHHSTHHHHNHHLPTTPPNTHPLTHSPILALPHTTHPHSPLTPSQWSWDRIPTSFQGAQKDRAFNDAEVKRLALYQMLTLEKWYTPCASQGPAQGGPACDVENKTLQVGALLSLLGLCSAAHFTRSVTHSLTHSTPISRAASPLCLGFSPLLTRSATRQHPRPPLSHATCLVAWAWLRCSVFVPHLHPSRGRQRLPHVAF